MSRKFLRSLTSASSDEAFLQVLKKFETIVAKLLSLAMVAVILAAVVELCIFVAQEIINNDKLANPDQFFTVTLIKVFGLFLNVLIALEVLENITAYLKKHVVQLELVVVTSLTAVARKIIIFDFTKNTGVELIGLAIAILTLSASYWLVRRINIERREKESEREQGHDRAKGQAEHQSVSQPVHQPAYQSEGQFKDHDRSLESERP